LELLHLDANSAQGAIELAHDAAVYRLRGALLPLVRLTTVLGIEDACKTTDVPIVVLQSGDRTFGLIVENVHDTEEIVVKPLPRLLQAKGAFSGATLMGDGSVSLILDIPGLAQKAGLSARRREFDQTVEAVPSAAAAEDQHVLLCCAVSDEHVALPLSSVIRLEEFPRGAIERTGGKAVVQYRGEVLPLFTVRKLLGTSRRRATIAREKLQVVVVASEGRQVGLVIDTILDIVRDSVRSWVESPRPGVLYSGIVANRVTEVLDIDSIVKQLAGAA
jgi:two-component system chemotaxis sensor kinase CheA